MRFSGLRNFWAQPATRSPLVWILFGSWFAQNIGWMFVLELRRPSMQDRMMGLLAFALFAVETMTFVRYHNRVRRALQDSKDKLEELRDRSVALDLAILVVNPIAGLLISMTVWFFLIAR